MENTNKAPIDSAVDAAQKAIDEVVKADEAAKAAKADAAKTVENTNDVKERGDKPDFKRHGDGREKGERGGRREFDERGGCAVVSVANALTVRRVLMARLMVVVVKVAVAAGVNGWRFLVSLWHPV